MSGLDKVSRLEGAELDYWVARALGFNAVICTQQNQETFSRADAVEGCLYIRLGGPETKYSPSRRWNEAGPIIEREGITLIHFVSGDSSSWGAEYGRAHYCDTVGTEWNAAKPLIAAMRCFVASKFGETVGEQKAA